MALCPHSCGSQHISLDIDVPFGQHKFEMKLICKHTRKSAGGNTHYLLCWPKTHILRADAMFTIRVLLHDDIERVESDRVRFEESNDIRFAEGVLFDSKNGINAGEWS